MFELSPPNTHTSCYLPAANIARLKSALYLRPAPGLAAFEKPVAKQAPIFHRPPQDHPRLLMTFISTLTSISGCYPTARHRMSGFQTGIVSIKTYIPLDDFSGKKLQAPG